MSAIPARYVKPLAQNMSIQRPVRCNGLMQWLVGTILCLMLAACGTTPATLNASTADIAKAVGVAESDLILYAPASFANSNGGRLTVDFASGIFAQTQAGVHLLSYDRISKALRRDMTFDTATLVGKTGGVALVSGMFGRKQLQIRTENGFVACEIGGRNVASTVYDRLIKAGAPTFESPGCVSPVVEPQPVVIPIYIPSG